MHRTEPCYTFIVATPLTCTGTVIIGDIVFLTSPDRKNIGTRKQHQREEACS